MAEDEETVGMCGITGHLWVRRLEYPNWCICVRCKEERKINLLESEDENKKKICVTPSIP